MTKNGKERKSPTYLDDSQQFMIYKYCIEHKAVIQAGTMTKYRVQPKIIAEEINTNRLFPSDMFISEHHIRKSIEKVVEWQELLDNLPEPQATVQEEILQEEITRKNIIIENQKLEIEQLKKNGHSALIERVRRISAELNKVLHT